MSSRGMNCFSHVMLSYRQQTHSLEGFLERIPSPSGPWVLSDAKGLCLVPEHDGIATARAKSKEPSEEPNPESRRRGKFSGMT
jgi:hypothetical protein